jgi:hypothetical protein
MTRYAFLTAAMPVLAFAAPAFAQAPTVISPAPAVVDSAPTSVPGTVAVQTDPLTGDRIATVVLPPSPTVVAPSAPDEAMVWQPGHYQWSPDALTYVWRSGRYVAQAPQEAATWVAGHWEQGPDRWVWIDGHWD